MGFVKVYFINYYYNGEASEPIEEVRRKAKDASRETKHDVLVHMHEHTELACMYEPHLHEVYRNGMYVRNSQISLEGQ